MRRVHQLVHQRPRARADIHDHDVVAPKIAVRRRRRRRRAISSPAARTTRRIRRAGSAPARSAVHGRRICGAAPRRRRGWCDPRNGSAAAARHRRRRRTAARRCTSCPRRRSAHPIDPLAAGISARWSTASRAWRVSRAWRPVRSSALRRSRGSPPSASAARFSCKGRRAIRIKVPAENACVRATSGEKSAARLKSPIECATAVPCADAAPAHSAKPAAAAATTMKTQRTARRRWV